MNTKQPWPWHGVSGPLLYDQHCYSLANEVQVHFELIVDQKRAKPSTYMLAKTQMRRTVQNEIWEIVGLKQSL